jgi:hypothetical protein
MATEYESQNPELEKGKIWSMSEPKMATNLTQTLHLTHENNDINNEN